MGWDVKATADAVGEALNSVPSVTPTFDTSQAVQWLGIFAGLAITYWLCRPLIDRARRGLEETVFSNWRLALLGTTGVVLSLASGWTTWDGMRNFTKDPALSLMFTFGIQGVMLIAAWLIGESFATGMATRAAVKGRGARSKAGAVVGALVGLVAFFALSLVVLQMLGKIDVRNVAVLNFDWSRFGDQYLLYGAGLLVLIYIAIAAGDVTSPYIQGTRVILKNAMLWVMFLACCAASVFFSFDSLFTAIFPQEERARAAELRAQNQVAGIIADIGSTIETRRIPAIEDLFAKDGWGEYDKQLDALYKASDGADKVIEAHFVEIEEGRRAAIAEQQQRATTAEGAQVGLAGKKTSLTDELARLKAERPALAAEFAEKKHDLDERAKEIDAKRVDAMAEDKGVEGTGKVGKGPVYRERMGELGKLQDYYKVGEERVKDAQKRLDAVNTRIGQIERELATVDGDLAKLQGEASTAQSRIKMAEAQVTESPALPTNPDRIRAAFQQARVDFRQEPSEKRLDGLSGLCTQLYGALAATAATKDRITGIDCDPKAATEASAVVFALDKGRQAFGANCAGGEKLAANTTTDALFGFARRCLADSGLPSKETDTLRAKINGMELARDDKAHRFVVTWNAFEDGNRLAYLALAIAIAIDSLVFMSGLFGANSMRSPLSDVPNIRPRTAQQLEATINAALGVRQYETATLMLSTLRPIRNQDGFTAEAVLDGLDRGAADRVRQVLTAGADIGAVEPIVGQGPERYRVRGELREYLSTIADKHMKADPSHARKARMLDLVRASLKPHTKEHAEIVLTAFSAIYPDRGFTSKVDLNAVKKPSHQQIIARVMNAGTALEVVSPEEGGLYYIQPALYETLLEINANDPPSPEFLLDQYGSQNRAALPADTSQPPIPLKEHKDLLPGGGPGSTRQIPDMTKRGGVNGAKPQRKVAWFWGGRGVESSSVAAVESQPDHGEDIDQSAPDDELPSELVVLFANKFELSHGQVRTLLIPAHTSVYRDLAAQLKMLLGTIAENAILGPRIRRLESRKREAVAKVSAELIEKGADPLFAVYFDRILPLILLIEKGAYERMIGALDDHDRQNNSLPGGRRSEWGMALEEHLAELTSLPRRELEEWPPIRECLRRFSLRLSELRDATERSSGNAAHHLNS